MGAGDGFVIGLKKVLDHGPAALRWNLVLLAEGFQASEMPQFHQEVSKFVDKLFNTPPFEQRWCGINIYRLDVASNESGADEPSGGTCTGSGATRATFFDATFCSNGIQRLLTVNNGLAFSTVAAALPQYDEVIVVVNSTTYGGAGGTHIGTYSLGFSPVTGQGGVEIAIHELGHSAFGLADEYPYDSGDTYGGSEPSQPNITKNTDKTTIKWKDLIAGPTAVPTQSNPDCTQEDPNPSPVAAGTVGAFEGAGYFHCGLFRPEFDCEMRALAKPFCAVCRKRILDTLEPFMMPVSVTLVTPAIDFKDIPEGIGGVGVTTHRSALFEIGSCTPVTLQVTAGPTGGFSLPQGAVVVVNPGQVASEGRIWVSYTSTTAGSMASGSMTVQAVETSESWVIPITANTVARPKTAVAMVLDHSGSMSEDAGDGNSKVKKLREAAKTFVDVMLAGDGLGLVRFDDTAQVVMNVDDVAVNGGLAKTTIDGPQFDPAGATSIGDGLQKGSTALAAAPAGFTVKAMVVLTDGMENTPPLINSVSGLITANTFAVGLGKASNVDVGKLEVLTGTHEGYLLVTGALTTDQTFRLQKYFLQILAGVTNANIVLDPGGVLHKGAEHRIPFNLTEADYGADVILLATEPRAIDFQLETPDGQRIDPGAAGSEPNIGFVVTPQVGYYRIGLPALPANADGSHGGRWHAVLRLGGHREVAAGVAAQAGGKAMAYNLIVHSYSNLQFNARLAQPGRLPPSDFLIDATLTEYGVPVEQRARVWAELTRPDGSNQRIDLNETGPGRFSARTTETLMGLYVFRLRAGGLTLGERPFTREKTLTGVVGQDPVSPTGPVGDSDLCKLVDCLSDGKVMQPRAMEQLKAMGVDGQALLKCLRLHCRQTTGKG